MIHYQDAFYPKFGGLFIRNLYTNSEFRITRPSIVYWHHFHFEGPSINDVRALGGGGDNSKKALILNSMTMGGGGNKNNKKLRDAIYG